MTSFADFATVHGPDQFSRFGPKYRDRQGDEGLINRAYPSLFFRLLINIVGTATSTKSLKHQQCFFHLVMMCAILMFVLSLLQAPWLVQCQSIPQYGYNGPGVYRIISPSSNSPIGFNISTKDNIRPVVSVYSNAFGLFPSRKQALIDNAVTMTTKMLLSAGLSLKCRRAMASLPWSL